MAQHVPAASSAPYRKVRLGDLTPVIEQARDGSLRLRAREPLGTYPRRVTDRLVHWAAHAPDRTLLAWRDGSAWAHLSYATALAQTRHLGQALLDRGLSSERPLAILSGNGPEHLLLALAAQHVGIPFAPISPAYSLLSSDFGALRRALDLITPGLVFADDLERFGAALAAAVPDGTEVVTRQPAAGGRPATAFSTLLGTSITDGVDRAHAAIEPDSVAKILFTSGSTGSPKGVINTHRMLCSNQQMILQAFPVLADEPPVLVDWLPWHHTFGGNHNIGIVLYNGGSLYIDNGRPMPGAFDDTVRNLKEIPTTVYMNVPKGFDALVRAMQDDADLARMFFQRVRYLFYAAASLPQSLAEALQELAVRACGERLLLITGLGATETAPMAICRPWDDQRANAIGLPVPGLTVKLVPSGDRYEVRVLGPNVMPGFWRQDDLTRAAFDDEGFYRMGDAVRFVDPRDPGKGLVFDGRIAEDFKLSTGTWVHVGPLRARLVAHFTPYLRDAVITGHDRDELGMLAVPDVDACRTLCPDLAADAPPVVVLGHTAVRRHLGMLLAQFASRATGSATRVVRAWLLEEPPSLDAGEITDKGSLNQRAVLQNRPALVAALHGDPPPAAALTVPRPPAMAPRGARA